MKKYKLHQLLIQNHSDRTINLLENSSDRTINLLGNSSDRTINLLENSSDRTINLLGNSSDRTINLLGSGLNQTNSSNTCEYLGFPEIPSIINTDRSLTKRLIAIGDIHGDLDLALNCLTIANVIKQVYLYKDKDTVEIKDEESDILSDFDDEDDEYPLKRLENAKHFRPLDLPDNIVTLKYKDEVKPRYYKWIGQNTVVIQVGDQVDRCRPVDNECDHPNETVNDEASDVKILFLFHDLHLEALKSPGCAVYSLLGNHELLNVLGNLRYVSYKGLEEFKKKDINSDQKDLFEGRKKAFDIKSDLKLYKEKSNLSNFLACARVSSIIVDKYLFVHAGILEKLINYTNKFSNKKETIHTINDSIKNWLLNSNLKKDNKYVAQLLSGKTLSPFWPRIFGNLPSGLDKSSELCTNHVDPVLKKLGLKGLVVGHTPQLKININSTCSDTVWRVDVGSSQAFEKVFDQDITDQSKDDKQKIKEGRKPQVLEIILNDDGEDTFSILK
jgi:hypothetical protein